MSLKVLRGESTYVDAMGKGTANERLGVALMTAERVKLKEGGTQRSRGVRAKLSFRGTLTILMVLTK